MRVLGAPTFRRNQRVLVFLSRRKGGLFVTGMTQGKFNVMRDTNTGKWMVARTLRQIQWTQGKRPRSVFTLRAFARHIDALVAAEKRGRNTNRKKGTKR